MQTETLPIFLGCALFAWGCIPLPDAPADLDGVSRYLFRYHEFSAESLAGTLSLVEWLSVHGQEEEGLEGYRISAMTVDDLSGIDRPDRDPQDTLGVVVWAESSHTLEEHLRYILKPDQSVVNPEEYQVWDRVFVEGEDCFSDRACDLLRTENDTVRELLPGVVLTYSFHKNYRRILLMGEDGVEREALLARGWVPEESFSEDGANGIHQSYHIDVLMEGEPGGPILRLQAQWGETKTALGDLLSDDYLVSETADGIRESFENTDLWLDGQ